MAYIDTTFARGGMIVNTIAAIHAGWDSGKRGNQFYGEQRLDYKGDVTLAVRVWAFSGFATGSPGERFDYRQVFPADFSAQFEAEGVKCQIASGRAALSLDFLPMLPWIVTENGKPAINWGPYIVAQYRTAAYLLRHMIVFNLPRSKRGGYRAWDLLPFLPGGLVERNPRRH